MAIIWRVSAANLSKLDPAISVSNPSGCLSPDELKTQHLYLFFSSPMLSLSIYHDHVAHVLYMRGLQEEKGTHGSRRASPSPFHPLIPLFPLMRAPQHTNLLTRDCRNARKTRQHAITGRSQAVVNHAHLRVFTHSVAWQ